MQVVSANRLADGIVVYMDRDGTWAEHFCEAKIFAAKAEAESALLAAQNDAKRHLIVEPCLVDIKDDPSGVRPASLRESIRALGPTIDFLPCSGAVPRVRRAADGARLGTMTAHSREEESPSLARERSLESA